MAASNVRKAVWLVAVTTVAATIIWTVGSMSRFFSSNTEKSADVSVPPVVNQSTPDEFAAERRAMVERQLRRRDIVDPRVLEAMGRVQRHRFISPSLAGAAYADHPLPIGHSQTISQPYIVALMSQLVQPKPESRVLEVGVGCGYQTAVLAELCRAVYGVEILSPLAQEAEERLQEMGYRNVSIRCGDGYRGWPEHAPFDGIVVAAAAEEVPNALLEQLAIGGRLVMPVGTWYQDLLLVEKGADGSLKRTSIAPVAFVPMTGEVQRRTPDE